MTGIHPWRRFRQLAHYTLHWHDEGPVGLTDFVGQTVSLRRDLDQAGRRSTILHECLHVERGPVPMGLVAKEESRVERETARLLMPDVKVVGEALAWAYSLEEAAAELWVDVQALRVRLRYLHPAERGWLQQRLEDVG